MHHSKERRQARLVERIHLDRANPDILVNEMIVADHAVTRPWSIVRKFDRNRNPKWGKSICSEDNHRVVIAKEDYLVSWEGFLMPVNEVQKRSDLKYIEQSQR